MFEGGYKGIGVKGRGMVMSNFENKLDTRTAIIPKGTVITGNIEIDGKLEMYGTIHGDIYSNSRVNLCGEVIGNLEVSDLYTKDSYIEGKIDCQAGAVIRENTVVLGDINAESLMVDGAIQGKLDIKGCINVGEKAIIDSDIKAKSIQVSNGAAINGHCSLCYAETSLKDFFPQEPQVKVVEGNAKNTAKDKNRKNAS